MLSATFYAAAWEDADHVAISGTKLTWLADEYGLGESISVMFAASSATHTCSMEVYRSDEIHT